MQLLPNTRMSRTLSCDVAEALYNFLVALQALGRNLSGASGSMLGRFEHVLPRQSLSCPLLEGCSGRLYARRGCWVYSSRDSWTIGRIQQLLIRKWQSLSVLEAVSTSLLCERAMSSVRTILLRSMLLDLPDELGKLSPFAFASSFV